MAAKSFFAPNAAAAAFIPCQRWAVRPAWLQRTADVPAFRLTGLKLHTGPDNGAAIPTIAPAESSLYRWLVAPHHESFLLSPWHVIPSGLLTDILCSSWEDQISSHRCLKRSTGGGFRWMDVPLSRLGCSGAWHLMVPSLLRIPGRSPA